MDRRQALAIVAQQVLFEAWADFTDQQWEHPQYELDEYAWQSVLEDPFIFGPKWTEFAEAIEYLGGDPNA